MTQSAVDFLVSHKILPETAKLRLMAYDVDEDGFPCPEVDYVFVNGFSVKNNGTYAKLSGANETWSVPSFSIPIEYLKFPQSKGQGGNSPQANNRIEIQIDILGCVAPDGHPAWAVQIDWGMIEIPSPIRPIIFAHGWKGTTTTFNNFERTWMVNDAIPSAGQVDLREGILRIVETTPLLEDAIELAIQEFGVDKVNIFAHSKGGLVTRQALWDDDIARYSEHVITFASPHHGTTEAEADLKLEIACRVSGFNDTRRFELCMSSGRELSRDRIRETLNYTGCTRENSESPWENCRLIYTPQPNVEYYSFAANGDEAVKPLSSTTYPWVAWENGEVPFPDNIDVDQQFDVPNSIGWGGDDHKGILAQERVYRCAISYIDSEIYNSSICPASPSPTEVEVMDAEDDYQIILTEGGNLPVGGSQTLVANLDSSTTAIFEVYSDKSLTYTLIDPNGQLINPAVAETNPNITYVSKDNGALWLYQYQISNPEVGSWQNVLQASNAVNYVVTNLTNSAVHLGYKTDQYTYRPGDLVTLEAALADGTTALTGVTFAGSVTYPDNSNVVLSFYDTGTNGDTTAGDGVYTAQFNAGSMNGYAKIHIDATKSNITRLVEASIAVAAQTAQIQQITGETPIDSNGNGLYDSLELDLSVNVINSGHFDFQASLIDGNGQLVATAYHSTRLENSGPLPAGIQTIKLSFDGQTIQQHGVNGPYVLTNLIVFDTTEFTLKVDSVTNFYTTATYQVNQFERPLLAIAGSNETPIDNDGNGKYDVLRISLTIDVVNPGTYQANGRLVDPAGGEIAWSSTGFYASTSGPQLAQLDFDGLAIGDHGVNGPYTLQDLSVANTTGVGSKIFDPAYTTQTYNVTAFERSPSMTFLPLILKNVGGSAVGFNSQFNGSASGWQPHSGSWSVDSNFYSTTGIADKLASASYNASFTNFNYQAKLWRYGCDTCANKVIIRGTPTPLDSSNDWYSQYSLHYTRGGYYSIWKRVAGGSWTALQAWTISSAINQSSAWNTIRVVANGGNLYFYINGVLVKTVTDTALSSGRVGIGMYRSATSTGDQLFADWATLSTLGTTGLEGLGLPDTVSPEQQALNDEANQNQVGGDNINQYQP